MSSWKAKSASEQVMRPNEFSRFTLAVRRNGCGKWQAFVSDEEVDEGQDSSSLSAAKKAAQDAYDNYYADFEDPSGGF